jgi:transcriptional regulator with XRE-family HTH domain
MGYDILTGEQIRAARALSRIEQVELAEAAGLSVQTIKRLERFQGPIDATTRTVTALTQAFLRHGVVFDLSAGAGPGLRLINQGQEKLSRAA